VWREREREREKEGGKIISVYFITFLEPQAIEL
jgi:hypothetical protein